MSESKFLPAVSEAHNQYAGEIHTPAFTLVCYIILVVNFLAFGVICLFLNVTGQNGKVTCWFALIQGFFLLSLPFTF